MKPSKTNLPLTDDSIRATLPQKPKARRSPDFPPLGNPPLQRSVPGAPFYKVICDTRTGVVLEVLWGRHRSLQGAQKAARELHYRNLHRSMPVEFNTGAADHGIHIQVRCEGTDEVVYASAIFARVRHEMFINLGGVEQYQGTVRTSIDLIWLTDEQAYQLTEASREQAA